MAISFKRWLQIKRIKKLCNNDSVPKKGDQNFDPTYKYDYIFKCVINNVNYLTKHAELDATIDETTFVTASPGKSGAGVTFRVIGKPNVSKEDRQSWSVTLTASVQEHTTTGTSSM